ncbi:right-handed parallel beta-helix repeat-containing protein [Priestia megaterium]
MADLISRSVGKKNKDDIGNLSSNLNDRGINIMYPPPPLVAAKGDGLTDDRLVIQAIIDSGVDAIYIPNHTFVVSHNGQTYTGKGTGVGLKLRSNLKIYGTGTIKYKENQAGNFAVMANVDDSIENCHVEGITIDGNSSNLKAGASVSNLVLFGAKNCSYKDVKSKNASYCGLMIRGAGTQYNTVQNCKVEDSGYIGIQCQRHVGLKVQNNVIRNSVDNGIDIEGNDDVGGLTNLGFGKQVIITGNLVDSANSGVFIESTGQTIISNNHLYNVNVGVFINRIDSGSYMNNITGNTIINMPWQATSIYRVGDRVVYNSKMFECTVGGTSSTTAPSHATGTATDGTVTWLYIRSFASNYGMRFTNNVGESNVQNNFIKGFTHGIRMVSTVSYLVITNNTFSDIAKYLVSGAGGTNILIYSQIGQNYYKGSQSNGFPKTATASTESPIYPNRFLNVGIVSAISLSGNAPLRDTYYRTSVPTNNTRAGFNSAYAIFDGTDTKVYVPNASIVAGEYLKINGTFYYVSANSNDEITIKNSSQVSGDYTSSVNGNYTVYVHRSTEYSALIID